MTHAATDQDPLRRIGVFGGTFDPIHLGHLHIANGLRERLNLDQIIWVVGGKPPHKRGQIVSEDDDRLAMVRLALGDTPEDIVSRVEVDRPGPSYTVDTLERLTSELGPARYFFLMGEDSLRDFATWRDPARILELADLGVVGRPGIDTDLADLTATLRSSRNSPTRRPKFGSASRTDSRSMSSRSSPWSGTSRTTGSTSRSRLPLKPTCARRRSR